MQISIGYGLTFFYFNFRKIAVQVLYGSLKGNSVKTGRARRCDLYPLFEGNAFGIFLTTVQVDCSNRLFKSFFLGMGRLPEGGGSQKTCLDLKIPTPGCEDAWVGLDLEDKKGKSPGRIIRLGDYLFWL